MTEPSYQSTYQAPAWLPSGNLQTIYAFFLPRIPVAYRRERVETPDGDFIDFDWFEADKAKPTLVMFHGLEGSSKSHYALAAAHAAHARGWNFVVPHFRGCSGEPNRTVRAYHSGDAESIEWMLAHVHKKICAEGTNVAKTLFAAGISLGGNALTKFCGTKIPSAQNLLTAAASVCAPIDLTACGERIDRGFNKVYTAHFLKTMKANAARKVAQFPGAFDAARAAAAKSIADFDDAYTGPVHGYAGVADYYQKASARQNLSEITIPFLFINAENDPFVPSYLAPRTTEVSPTITLDLPATGGHLGFVSGPFPGNLNWLPQRLLTFFETHVHR